MSELLLAGGGHCHALLLQRWALAPHSRPAVAAITLVSRQGSSLYSGLVPQLFAAQIALEACQIDLRRLCVAAQVAFVEAEISGLDLDRQELHLHSCDGTARPALPYRWLSLNLGAEITASTTPATTDATRQLPIKPLEPVLAALEALTPGAVVQLIGSGAAAIELGFGLSWRGLKVQLFVKASYRPYWGRFAAALNAAGVELRVDGTPGPADLRLLCTGSRGPQWLKNSGLSLDANGRIYTNAQLQVRDMPQLFASGDCAVISDKARPASGVWAVRAVPTLAANLRRAALGKPLRQWQPQKHALQLLGNSRGAAYGEWGPLHWGPNRWSWLLKQHLDKRFIAMLQQQTAAMQQGLQRNEMACSGCAAKLAAQPLSNALQRLGQPRGVEDAAAMGDPIAGVQWLQSIDGFPALVADPWLNARLTALHACSDLWASGAQLHSAQVFIQLPRCDAALQENLLLQCLAGIKSVLEPLGAELLGGHSLQDLEPPKLNKPLSQQLLLALSLNGQAPSQRMLRKGPLHAGDVLLLSRPLGTGVLFAAASAGAAKAHWIAGALALMQQSQADLVPLLAAHGCHACTDITGFALLGHLGEMLALSPGVQVNFENKLMVLPALAGALELLGQGYQSSLAPSNAAVLKQWPALLARETEAAVQLLLDPQTCGPLLASIPAAQAQNCLAAMQKVGFKQAAVIATVESATIESASVKK